MAYFAPLPSNQYSPLGCFPVCMTQAHQINDQFGLRANEEKEEL